MYESENISPAWLAILILSIKGYLLQSHASVDNEHLQNDTNPLTGPGCAHASISPFTRCVMDQRDEFAHLVRCIADGLDVGFPPFSWYPTNHLTIVHIIACNLCPSSRIWLLPSKNHWVPKTFKTSDVIGRRRHGCGEMNSSWVREMWFWVWIHSPSLPGIM